MIGPPFLFRVILRFPVTVLLEGPARLALSAVVFEQAAAVAQARISPPKSPPASLVPLLTGAAPINVPAPSYC